MRYLFHIVLLLAFSVSPVTAQLAVTPDFSHGAALRQYTDENGLPQNSVNHLAFDGDGFLWFTTSAGLVRFDGRNFTVCGPEPDIRHVASDSSGNLYVLTVSGHLFRVSGGRVWPVPYVNLAENGVVPGSFLSAYLHGQTLPYAFDGTRYSYVIPARAGAYYTFTDKEARAFEGETERFSVPLPSGFGEPWRFFMVADRLYYLNEKGLVYDIDKKMRGIVPSGDLPKNRHYGRSGIEARPLSDPATGDLFIYIENSLYRVESDGNGGLSTRLLLEGFDFSDHAVSSVCYDDANGRLFLGSYTEGLFTFTKKQFTTLTFDDFVGEKFGNSYGAQVAFGSGILTTEGSMLGAGTPDAYIDGFSELADRGTLLKDFAGHIWSKHIGDVYRWDAGARAPLRKWTFRFPVSVLYAGADSCVWVGTQRPGGLYRIDPREPSSRPERIIPRLPDVTYIAEAAPGVLAVGTRSGLYFWDIYAKRLYPVRELRGQAVRSLYTDPAHPHEVWALVEGRGIVLCHGNGVTGFPLDREGFLADGRCMLRDIYGTFWITTGKGLFSVAMGDLYDFAEGWSDHMYYHHYGRSAGFLTNEFNGFCQPCGLYLPDGMFSFPSLNGLVRFRPEEITPEYASMPLYIDRVEVDGRTLVPRSDTLRLTNGFGRLHIRYATPYFGNPNNLDMEARLNDGPWEPAPPDGIVFTSLPAGTHELYLRKVNGPGPGNYTLHKMVLLVPRAFWQTLWFAALCVLLLGAGIYLYIRLRILFVQRRNVLLEEGIAERTRELKLTIQALNESRDIIGQDAELQKRLTATIAHDVKTPLKYLLLTAGSLAKTPPQELAKEHDTVKTVYDSLYRIYHFTDNLLDYIKSRFNDPAGSVVRENVSLRQMVGEKADIFSGMALSQGTVLENRVPDDLQIHCNRNLLSVVVHNLVDNAVKFTFGGKIVCDAVRREGEIAFSVTDTGVGILPEQMESIQLFLESDDLRWNPGYNGHNGLGLVIIKEIIRELGGRIVMDSEKDLGTTVVVYLPD